MFLTEEVSGIPAWTVPIILIVLLAAVAFLIIKLDRYFETKTNGQVCEKMNCFEPHTHRVSLKALMGPRRLFDGHPHTHRNDNGKSLFHSHPGGMKPHTHTAEGTAQKI